eukprot:TRINITY_DN2918_c0_g1_i7.p1 TRINITY_DN2918_c0_g1~~TRINITY_DN2918_c0_g1_i7.p1  ORF type:complete len:147 (-),score=1.41 TRINITY_DN2918_c0_g1_i7:3-413(-)
MVMQPSSSHHKRLLSQTSNNRRTILLAILFISALLGVFTIRFVKQRIWFNYNSGRILVMYIFSNTDPAYAYNLQYFVREGIRENDGCDYVFVIQKGEDITPLDPLPKLPSLQIVMDSDCVAFDASDLAFDKVASLV